MILTLERVELYYILLYNDPGRYHNLIGQEEVQYEAVLHGEESE